MTDFIFVGHVMTLGSVIQEKGAALNVSSASVKKIRVKTPGINYSF